MLHHLSLGVRDLEAAARFYDAVLAPLGYGRVWSDLRPGQPGQAVGYGVPGGGDRLALKQHDATPLAAGPGFHLAFAAPSRAAVDRFHAAALQHGGRDNGAPGLRPQYGERYYAAYVADPDGHRLEAVTTAAPVALAPRPSRDAPALDIRRLGADDAAAYRTLMLDAYARHPQAYTSSSDEGAVRPLSWWQQRLDEGARSAVWGAHVGRRLVAVAGLQFAVRTKERHKATLFGMFVEPALRGRGIGRQLVEAVLQHARSLPQLRQVQLTVTEGNDDARALYERCGFVAYGVEPCAVVVDGHDLAKVHMACDLAHPGGDTPR